MKGKGILSLALALALSSTMAVTAYAAETSADEYGYLSGSQKSSQRHAQYEKAEALSTDAERDAFFEANDIGGAYSDASHLDTDALVAAGVIDQATADRIAQYAADKHSQLSGRYADVGSMAPAERQAYFEGLDRSGGDSVDALLAAGIITQAQAEAINAYLAE